MFAYDLPTREDLDQARTVFEAREPRDLFYSLATWMMQTADLRDARFDRAEALAVLLQTWNRGYYQRRRVAFDNEHYAAIRDLVERHLATLRRLDERGIEGLDKDDEQIVRSLYQDFESVLGPTGASKALHLLAPRFMPIWDSEIAARAYHLYRRDDRDYWRLVIATCDQVNNVGGQQALGRNPIKAIDEYNFCKYTLRDPALA